MTQTTRPTYDYKTCSAIAFNMVIGSAHDVATGLQVLRPRYERETAFLADMEQHRDDTTIMETLSEVIADAEANVRFYETCQRWLTDHA